MLLLRNRAYDPSMILEAYKGEDRFQYFPTQYPLCSTYIPEHFLFYIFSHDL